MTADISGRVLHSLGREYDPYLLNGFQLSVDRTTLYYTRLNEPAQTIEIVAVPVAGGVARVVANGVNPQPSPDGATMAFLPFSERGTLAIQNLASGARVDSRIPGVDTDHVVFSVAWLSDSRHVIVVVGALVPFCSGPAGFSCRSTPTPTPALAEVLDVTSATWSPLPSLEGVTGGWSRVSLRGPARSATTVLATTDASATSAAVVAINVSTGRVTAQTQLPEGASFLARDLSGTHFLLASHGELEAWSAGDLAPTTVGLEAAEAAW